MAKPILARADLIRLIQKSLSLSARDAGEIIDSLVAAIIEGFHAGRPIKLPNLGVLSARITPPRLARNPKTGEVAKVHPRRRPTFTLSPKLRQRLSLTFGENAPVAPPGPDPNAPQ
ncbi:MAG: HU family DNA-binding protein [Deltaproteobacteria bacterium]|jgi:nucleoid DNA-binding protein|nr:HU family DNA-binding protein [Deltaproteobacteria bacterium]